MVPNAVLFTIHFWQERQKTEVNLKYYKKNKDEIITGALTPFMYFLYIDYKKRMV